MDRDWDYDSRTFFVVPIELDYVHVQAEVGRLVISCTACNHRMTFYGTVTLGRLCDIMADHMRNHRL